MKESMKETYAGLKAAREDILAAGYHFDKEMNCWLDENDQEVPRHTIDNFIDLVARKHLGRSLCFQDTFDY